MKTHARTIYAAQVFNGMHPELWELMKDRNIPNWRTEGSTTTLADAVKFISKLSDEEIECYTTTPTI